MAAAALVAFALVTADCAEAVDDRLLAAREQEVELLLAQTQSAIATPEVMVLELVVNEQKYGTAFVRTAAGGAVVAIDEAALRSARIRVPDGSAQAFEGRRFVPVAALAGLVARIDTRAQRLVVTAPASLFDASAVTLGQVAGVPLSPPPWSAFANYEIFGYGSQGASYGAGWFELGTSGPYGVGVATLIANSAEAGGGSSGKATVLDATWRYDAPTGPTTLLLGTAISRSGAWGRSLRFGGAQYGTNFNLQPDLITYPLLAFSGTAVVPSTVDVLVNGQRVGSQPVPAGPFTINNVPVVTGSGDVQLVVRNAFGQQQVLSQPFYASRQLLKPGLDDYTISAGALRQNYGIESFDYASGYLAGYWRRGMSDALTVEVRAEGDNHTRAAGAAVDFVPGLYGVVTVGAAGSSGDAGSGVLTLAGYQYQDERFNAGFRGSWASPAFRMAGDDGLPPQQRLILGNIGYNFGKAGSIGAAYIGQQNRGQALDQTGTISYSTTFAQGLFFNLSLSRSTGSAPQTGLIASIVMPLDGQTSASADFSTTRSSSTTHNVLGATVQRSLPIGEGWGYRVRATTDEQYQAGVAYAGPYGKYGAEVAYGNGITAARGSIAGGIGYLEGRVFAARPIVDSFGIVRVEGVADVEVYQNGSFAGRTDAEGLVVLTQMNAYSANRITIDDRVVPIDVTLNTREIKVAPYYRAAVIVDFGARKTVSASVAVRLPDGRSLPSGAEVRRADGRDTLPVGDDGDVYIADLAYGVPYVAEWAGGRCVFRIAKPVADPGPMPRFGPLQCVAARE